MTDPDRLILLGEIGAAHGIRGEVAVRTFTADPADIAAYGALSDKTGTRSFTITGLRVTAKAVVARFAASTTGQPPRSCAIPASMSDAAACPHPSRAPTTTRTSLASTPSAWTGHRSAASQRW